MAYMVINKEIVWQGCQFKEGDTFYLNRANGIEECTFIGIGLTHESSCALTRLHYYDHNGVKRSELVTCMNPLVMYPSVEDVVYRRNGYRLLTNPHIARSIEGYISEIDELETEWKGSELMLTRYYFDCGQVRQLTERVYASVSVTPLGNGRYQIGLCGTAKPSCWPNLCYATTYPTAEDCVSDNIDSVRVMRKATTDKHQA